MDNTFHNHVQHNHNFPQENFELVNNQLHFHGVNLLELIEVYGTPLKLTYLPKISEQVTKARSLFAEAMKHERYNGKYTYCYCTKSSHFSFVVEEALRNNVQLETSSAYDIHIVEKLISSGHITSDTFLIHNGYKRELYLQLIAKLINGGYNSITVLDNQHELDTLLPLTHNTISVGIRMAIGEEPHSNYYTSRLGIRSSQIVPYYLDHIKVNPKVKLKMLHFFVDSGIEDSAHYWNELAKCVSVYCELKKHCPNLSILNIGGGFPVQHSLSTKIDYQTLATGIVRCIKQICSEHNTAEPDIFTEFGSFTIAESGATIYSIIDQKKQNDVECWNMIDSSFITTLPDTWGIDQKFILLPINRWNEPYERVILGGLTCDSQDYYNEQSHDSNIYLPKFHPKKPLFIGFFHTGAYQNALGGYGGIQHCLIPSPKQILVQKNSNGTISHSMFSPDQPAHGMMQILGY